MQELRVLDHQGGPLGQHVCQCLDSFLLEDGLLDVEQRDIVSSNRFDTSLGHHFLSQGSLTRLPWHGFSPQSDLSQI
jgi:hypothetical protein